MGKCWMCAHYTGDCGHHRMNTYGHIDYDNHSFDMETGDDPECFEVSPTYIKERYKREAQHIVRCYSREVIELASQMIEENPDE